MSETKPTPGPCRILLSQGYVALVDEADYAALATFKWHAHVDTHTVYARRNCVIKGKRTAIGMHVQIMGTKGIDHRDGNGLNNQRVKLRLASSLENARNFVRPTSMAGFRGVCPTSDNTGKFRATIYLPKSRVHLGRFKHAYNAALAYNLMADELFGEFAIFNTPNGLVRGGVCR